MSLKKDGYIERIIDTRIEKYLGLFGGVLIEGPKWCGKTWTSLNHANSVTYMMDPLRNYNNRTIAELNPAMVLPGESPHLIDEWQVVPGIWDAVRFNIDSNSSFGKYILTGSTLPLGSSYEHSGTGRIATLQMRPMSLYESSDSLGAISLGELFKQTRFDPFIADIDLISLIDITIRGGWPESLKLPLQKAGSISEEYINSLVRNDLFHDNQSRRDSEKMRKLLRALARNNASKPSIKTLTADIDGVERQSQTVNDIAISRQTVTSYLKSLAEIFVIESIPSWNPDIQSRTVLRQASKRIFCDPSLAIASLGVSREKLLGDLYTYGFMFENLCLRDLSIYADYHGGRVYYYHDNSNLEVDAIIEMRDGSWGAFEIKLGENQVESAAKTLKRMVSKVVAAGSQPPSCMVVITGGGITRLREDGIYVVPINALKY